MFHAVLDFGVAKARSYLMFVTSHQMNVSTAAHSNYRMTFKRKGNMDELLDVQGYLLWGRQKNLTFLREGHVLWRPGGKLTFAGLYIVLPSDPCNLIGKQILGWILDIRLETVMLPSHQNVTVFGITSKFLYYPSYCAIPAIPINKYIIKSSLNPKKLEKLTLSHLLMTKLRQHKWSSDLSAN